jgi:translation initiation factor 4A
LLPAAQIESNNDETVDSFDDMALKSELIRGVYNYGFERPSAVQQRVIAPVIKGEREDGSDGYSADQSADETIKGQDVIMEAPFTTGKTQAICIAALQTFDADLKTCQALMLTSSFSEVQKIVKFTTDIGQFMQLDCPASVGRRNIEDNISALHEGQQFVVGTPRRVLELIQLDAIKIDSTKLLVLDDADEMLARDFSEHILATHQHMPDATQGVVLSATMPQEVLDIATKVLRNPLHIIVSKCGRPLHRAKQVYISLEKEDQKLDVLSHLNDIFSVTQAVIFCNTRRTLEWLASEFASRSITTSAMHADMPAFERADLLQDFRSSSTTTLLATNMLARGIEVRAASLILNYDLPAKYEDYFHRTSSGSRFAEECTTVNLITAAEVGKVREIEHFYNTTIEEMPVPLLLRT